MRFKVPVQKDPEFASSFFKLIEDPLIELKIEHGKWPDRISFSGPLGKELHLFLIDLKWDLASFNPGVIASPVNKIVFEYSKPLDQVEERGGTLFDQSLKDRQISGIPGKDTIAKIVATYAAPAFKIEKKIQPKKEILLTR